MTPTDPAITKAAFRMSNISRTAAASHIWAAASSGWVQRARISLAPIRCNLLTEMRSLSCSTPDVFLAAGQRRTQRRIGVLSSGETISYRARPHRSPPEEAALRRSRLGQRDAAAVLSEKTDGQRNTHSNLEPVFIATLSTCIYIPLYTIFFIYFVVSGRNEQEKNSQNFSSVDESSYKTVISEHSL